MSSDDSVYRAPESPLDRPSQGSARSLDDAIAGNFDFEIGNVLREAWELVSGSKGVILGAIAIQIVLAGLNEGIGTMLSDSDNALFAILAVLVAIGVNIVSYTISAGLYLYGIKRAAGDESASFEDVLSCFSIALPIVGLVLLQGFLSVVGFLLLVIPGIYLIVAYGFALPLKVERGLGIWESLETSRKAVTTAWWKVAGVFVVVGLAVAVGGVLSLGIGLIWLIPFGTLAMGVMYREIFGYSPAAH